MLSILGITSLISGAELAIAIVIAKLAGIASEAGCMTGSMMGSFSLLPKIENSECT
jgi:hypothetical protein